MTSLMLTALPNLDSKDIVKCLQEHRKLLKQEIRNIDKTLKLYCSFAIVSYCYGHQVYKVQDDYHFAKELVTVNNSSLDREDDKWERGLQTLVPYKWEHDSSMVLEDAWRDNCFIGSNGHPWVETPAF